jgi:DNA-binding NarL/FixJ family response regulator
MPPTLTVVIADDDGDDRAIIRYLIQSAPDAITIVGEAEDGEEALALVRRLHPDVLLADLVMPRRNGVEITRIIKHELPQTRIVLLSSSTEDAYRLMVSDSGVDAFVSKQVINRNLLPAIRDVMARRLTRGNGPLPPNGGATSSPAPPPN